MAPNTYPAGSRPDWATICRWEDAGRPALNPDGTWDEPPPALAADQEGP